MATNCFLIYVRSFLSEDKSEVFARGVEKESGGDLQRESHYLDTKPLNGVFRDPLSA